jgi:uncharacterized protein (DUF2062 family)
MEHDGLPLAADETDPTHHRPAGVASIHTRALLTWLAIFPLAALGISLMARLAPGWPPVVKAFVLTAVIVPTTVYLTVPRLLLASLAASRRRQRRREFRTPVSPR